MLERAISPRIEPNPSTDGRWREALLIAVLALSINLIGNDRTSLWDRDEPRYAGCTREMIERGDWLYPTFNGEPRYLKPILIYWLMRAGFLVAGDNPFGARLVSAFAGMGTCLVVLRLGRRMLGERAGFFAALMLTTAPIMGIESKLATTDATLTLFLVSAFACLWELTRRESRACALGFWTTLALATLTKGPVGPALISCAWVASRCLHGPRIPWRRLEWEWGLPLFLLIAAPWYVAIGFMTHGDFYRFAVGSQVAARITTRMEEHGGFPGYYLVTSVLTFYPWSCLMPAGIVAAWGRRRADPMFGFLLGWAAGPMILLECVRTKLIHYYLPAYPACALLAAWLVREVVAEGVNIRRWPLGRLALGLLVGMGLGLVGVAGAGTVVPPGSLRWPCLAIVLIVAAGTLWSLRRFQQAETERAVLALALSGSLFMLAMGGWFLPALEPYRLTQAAGEKLAALARKADTEPMLLGFQEPRVVHAMRRPAHLIRTWPHMDELLEKHGTLATVMLPVEILEFGLRSEQYDVELLETIEGFNLNKGQVQTLRLALVRRKLPFPLARKPPSDDSLRKASGENFLVK